MLHTLAAQIAVANLELNDWAAVDAPLNCRHDSRHINDGFVMRIFSFFLITACCICPVDLRADVTVAESLNILAKTHEENSTSQQRIDKLALEAQHLLEEYQRLQLNSDYQETYNAELSKLDADQQQQIQQLASQLEAIKVTQEQLQPLMRTMADTLEKFVVLDLPFHQETRIASVLQLKQRLRDNSIALPERFRLLWEAYQLELNYNRSIETWRGDINTENGARAVKFLRLGRLALYYLNLDGSEAGYWQMSTGTWISLPEKFLAVIDKGIRIADGHVAPQLMLLPVSLEEQQP